MRYWLMKTEPDAFSWQDLLRDGVATWDGVRNYTARNNMRAMELGDRVLIYHSNIGKEAVGIARVVATAFQDPTTDDLRWSAVKVSPVAPLAKPVTLQTMREEHAKGGPLAEIKLIRENRLSVIPLTDGEWQHLLQLAETTEPE
jgi:predicted RNA-binding protein with PUA-like domain